MKLGKSFTVIHTGRFIEQKNQMFILDIFANLLVKCPDAKLLLLGTGKLLEKTKEYAKTLGILENVQFLGVKSNVEEYLCAADCYVMPSLYEGLPVAAVEAECTGLQCYLSTNITKEVALTDETYFLELSQAAEVWAKTIICNRKVDRHDKSQMVAKNGYDVKDAAMRLQNKYIKMARRG